jgi:putative salt-induced outer membrane protein YdiY
MRFVSPKRALLKKRLLDIVICGFSLVFSSAYADQVITGNGDQLTGFVSYLDGRKLKLSTSHSGSVSLNRRHIQSLILERNVRIRLATGQLYQGRLQSIKDGITLIETIDGETIELSSLDEIKYFYYVSPINKEFQYSGSLLAEVDLEHSEGGNNSKEWEVTLENSISYQNLRNRSKFEYEKDSTNDITTDRETLFDTSVDYFLSNKMFATSRFRYEEDLFENLNRRRIYGIGIGHQPWLAPFRKLLYSIDLVHLDEHYKEEGTISEQGLEFRLYYKEETMFDGLYFYHENNFLFLGRDDKRIETISTLEYGLPYNIGINLNYEWDYNDAPESGDSTTYSNLTFGVSYRW